MKLDDLLFHYFGTNRIEDALPTTILAGLDRLQSDLGQENSRTHRFALWALLYLVGEAPDFAVTFDHPADQEAAREFMDLLAADDVSEGAR